MKFQTGDARSKGVSGDLLLQTGDVIDNVSRKDERDAGKIAIATGRTVLGKGGDIDLSVGDARHADGGSINLSAGSSVGNTYHGGLLDMRSGESDFSTGDINLKTPDSTNGNTGTINIASGNSGSQYGQTGNIFLSTGDG